MKNMNVHPSIHHLYCLSLEGCGDAGSNSSWHWARGRVHSGQVASQSQGRHIETDNHSHSKHECTTDFQLFHLAIGFVYTIVSVFEYRWILHLVVVLTETFVLPIKLNFLVGFGLFIGFGDFGKLVQCTRLIKSYSACLA